MAECGICDCYPCSLQDCDNCEIRPHEPQEPVPDYRKARGAVPWHPPMLLPEDAIRLGRD